MKLGDEIYVHGFVDEIRKDCVIVKNKGGYFGTAQEEISEALPPIDLKMDRWIPVSERLPKEKGYYLVTRKNPKGHVTKVIYDPSRVERHVYNSPWGNGDADVLAWMELPKPYEVEEK